jgi:hypothetical protein
MEHPHSGYSGHSRVRAPIDYAPIDRKAQKGAIVLVIAGAMRRIGPRRPQKNPKRVLIWIKY